MAPPARTITVALDMSKAFDTINIHTLIRKLLQTNIPGTIIKFIANCTHLHHTLGALKRDFPASLVTPLPNSEQANLPSSNHTYTKSTPTHFHHHCAPSVTSTHTTHIISSTAPTYAPHCHPWICGKTPLEWLHCWPDGRRSWLVDHKREHRTPPNSKGHGCG